MVIEGLLRKLGIQPDCVEDGLAAVNVATDSSKRYDVILMDCEMPQLDGFEAVCAFVLGKNNTITHH